MHWMFCLDTGWPFWDPAIVERGVSKAKHSRLFDRGARSDVGGGFAPYDLGRSRWNASLKGLMNWNAPWVGKTFFAAGMVASPECVRCDRTEESIEHAFFHCSDIRPLCELIDSYIFCMLHWQFFALDASSLCSNVSSLMDRLKHSVLLFLPHLVAIFKHQLKFKIRVERERLSSGDIAERWMTVTRLFQVNGVNHEWHLELCDWIVLPGKAWPTYQVMVEVFVSLFPKNWLIYLGNEWSLARLTFFSPYHFLFSFPVPHLFRWQKPKFSRAIISCGF